MPEHDTFDLDAAFARLEQDVSTLSRSPGAAQVFRSARHRRQVRRGAIAAAVLLVGAGASVVMTHRANDVGPATRPVPAPAGLDATALDKATAGWAGPWDNLDMNASPERTLNPSCTINNDQSGSSSVNGGSGAFQTGDGHYVQFGAIRWDRGLRSYVSTLTKALEACPGARTTEVTYADDTHVSFVELPSLAGGATQWGIAVQGDVVLELAIGPTAGLSDEVQVRIADAMVAGLEVDAGMTALPQSGVGRIDPSETAGQVWPQTLEPALVGWSIPWSPRIPSGSSEADPNVSMSECIGRPDAHDNGNGLWINVGTQGAQMMHWAPSESAAVQEVTDIRHGLASCSTPYDIHTVTLSSGRPVVVAEGADVVLWFTRVASHVLVLQLPAGSSAPPDVVSVKIGEVLERVLERPAETTFSPDRTDVPSSLEKAIADAPTFGP